MQPTGNLVSRTTLTAIFVSSTLDATRILQTIRHIRQIAGELTIVMTDSTFPRDSAELSQEKLFFVPPMGGSRDSHLRNMVKKATELSPNSEKFMIFAGGDTNIISTTRFAGLEKRKDDFISLEDIQCMILSKRYADYVVSSGDVPSRSNAIKNGFSSGMSFKQIVTSPRDAARQYSTIIKFASVGASGVVVNLLILTLLKFWMSLIFANAIAVELSIINNFVWNDRYTFDGPSFESSSAKDLSSRLVRLVKYNIVSLVSLAVNETVFFFANSVGMWYIWSSILAICVGFVVNYSGSSRWAWRMKIGLENSAKN